MLAGITELKEQFLLHNGDKDECIENQLTYSVCPFTSLNYRNGEQTSMKLKAEENMIIKGSDSLRMKVWITPLRPTKVIAEGRGNLEWMIEEEEDESQLWLQHQLQIGTVVHLTNLNIQKKE